MCEFLGLSEPDYCTRQKNSMASEFFRIWRIKDSEQMAMSLLGKIMPQDFLPCQSCVAHVALEN